MLFELLQSINDVFIYVLTVIYQCYNIIGDLIFFKFFLLQLLFMFIKSVELIKFYFLKLIVNYMLIKIKFQLKKLFINNINFLTKY